jgi:2-dehydropantoate 2-reductase
VKVRVIGAGALGMMVAARLFRSGVKVELVSRTMKQAEEIRAQGLLLKGKEMTGEAIDAVVQVPVCAFEEMVAANFDWILLMVKQTSITDEWAGALGKQLSPSSRIVCYQNGIGHIGILGRHIPIEQLWVAVTTEGALKHSARYVEHTGSGTTWLGSVQASDIPKSDQDAGRILQKLLSRAGFSTILSNNINSKIWNKLLMNAVINPLTAILQVRNGRLPRAPAALPLMRTLFEEGKMLAERLGIELDADLWEQLLMVCERTADNNSSMLQDVLAGRNTEIEAITGGLLSEAQQAGVQIPTHSALYAIIRSIEQQREII